ncbi:MAG: sigma-70 family RNA polymerase sigma factor [Gemmatimonadaceae bacterium]|nr:sigma-70 family RNA polymerase sigma factor [Gemmatimonadaceae bacterium]
MTHKTPSDDITGWLSAWRDGDPQAMERLMPLMHATLRGLAAKHLQREDQGHTLSPTALVHEAWLRLVNQRQAKFEDRGHFLSLASRVMRRVLVDHARHLQAGKRTVPAHLPHDLEGSSTDEWVLTVIAVDDALDRLAEVDARLARVVECRFYAGLTEEETAEVLGITARTVHRNWLRARGWLEIALRD